MPRASPLLKHSDIRRTNITDMLAGYDFVQLDVFTQTARRISNARNRAYLYSTTTTAPDDIVVDLNVGKILVDSVPIRLVPGTTAPRGDVFGEIR